jgi:hypothetical protein
MTNYPDIPKRFAARIRGSQRAVVSKRDSIVYGAHNAKQSATRIAEFENDPQAFADRYYPGHDVDSYPVQTTIERERKRFDYNKGRTLGRLGELETAEAKLVEVELEVLRLVGAMVSTGGRVPWPTALPSFDKYQLELTTSFVRQDELAKREAVMEKAEREKLFAAELELIEREQAAFDEVFRAETRLRRELMTPEQRADEGAKKRAIVDAVKSNRISVFDIASGRVKLIRIEDSALTVTGKSQVNFGKRKWQPTKYAVVLIDCGSS